MPQGWLQVNRFVTPQNLKCTVSGAKNRAKSNFRKILPVTLTRSRFCEESFFLTQWNQDFMGHRGEGGTAVASGRWPVAREEGCIGDQVTGWSRCSPFAIRSSPDRSGSRTGGWWLATGSYKRTAGSSRRGGLGVSPRIGVCTKRLRPRPLECTKPLANSEWRIAKGELAVGSSQAGKMSHKAPISLCP